MIVTVTANTSIDHILWVPRFELNATLRASRFVESMGGKPTDASWILGELGVPSLALGFVAGLTGEVVKRLLAEKGVITVDFVPVAGESRRNIVIINDDGSGQTTITASTLRPTDADIAALRQKYTAALAEASCVVLGGTLPTGMSPMFYTELIAEARARGLSVIFDAAEPNLSAGLLSGPTFIKPNRDELSAFVGAPVTRLADAYHAGRAIFARYGAQPIITLGGDGGLAVLADRAYRIPALPVTVVNTAGAGDAVLAGLAAALSRGGAVEDGLRLGFAAATAVVTTPGTAQCHRADVLAYERQIELIPYSP
jgi:1-phosphofructokinase family hexose kinase